MAARQRGAKILPAIHPNAGLTVWYRQQLDKMLSESYLDATHMLSEAWRTAEPTIGFAQDASGELVMDTRSPILGVERALKKWSDKWRGKFDKLSDEVARSFTGKAFTMTQTSFQAALKNAGFTVSFAPTKKSLESYRAVVADNVGLIRNLQASYYNRIQQDVWASVRAGADMSTLSKKLQGSYDITTKRAALIARDQNAKAKAVIENTRRKELGIKFAIWQHSSAGKEPRPTHVAMNGKRFDLDEGMWDSDENEFVWPGQLINCRCTSRAIIPGLSAETE